MLEFRQLALSQAPWERLDAFQDRVVFQTREWLNYIAETQKAVPVITEIREGASVMGYFTGLVFRKFGVRILGSSFPGWTTPYMGFNLVPELERWRALEALGRWAFDELGCLHYEVSDRAFSPEDGLRLGLESFPYESYKTDLTKSEDDLFKAMESACRRCIRKAQKSGVVIQEAQDASFADDYYEQLKDVFAKQGKVPTYDIGRVRSLLKHVMPSGRLLAIRAISPDGNCIGTGIYPGMNDIAFFWGNASWRAEQHWRPNETLHWYAMRYWKARGVKLFDWGGGGTYKEKYGVEPRVVPWFYKSKYPLLTTVRNEARELFYRSQLLLGRLRGVRNQAAATGDHQIEN
jgi:hypothetical protein